MDRVCNSCATEINDELIRCYLCDSPFHMGCASIPEDVLKLATQYAQLHWCCIGSNNIVINPRTKRIKQVVVQSNVQTAMAAIADSLKSALEPLAKEIRSGFSQLNEAKTPLSSHPPAKLRHLIPAKRLFSEVAMGSHTSLTKRRMNSNINNNNINFNTNPSIVENMCTNVNTNQHVRSNIPPVIVGSDVVSPTLPTVENSHVPKLWLHLANIAPMRTQLP
ncbi:uncharacterized protein LOC128297979 [Anopheles moucheti]|uniref:uncharacterized protein LOC128297979 n=1 Tax=Anopheles moucheti TaxID=186751 RepID=UPI0022F0A26D|nr:uncharacterized protein LOC128297979 [Anopheles moucheti]